MSAAAYTPPPFPCSIVVVQPSGRFGKTFMFERKDWCVLGANPDCDIIVPFPGVAQLQALVYVKRNGVFLQGIDKHIPVKHSRLHDHLINEEELLLLPGDEFMLGERKFLIQYSAEDASVKAIDASTSLTQGSSPSKIASPGTANSRSRGTHRKRRKSSLVVCEFDEKYVSPRSGSETLLSKAQLARISKSEAEILREGDTSHKQNSKEASSSRTRPEDYSQESEDTCSSSTSDESSVFSDHRENVSRNIDFSTIERDLFSNESNVDQRGGIEAPEPCRQVPSRSRSDLVFTRLSKGLSATPRKGEKNVFLGRTNTLEQKASGYTQFEESKMLTGKENVPQSFVEPVSKSSRSHDSKEDEASNRIRSPLAYRSELQNQMEPARNQNGTPASRRRTGAARPTNSSVQTPRGRAVAFARSIELAAGAHYSPFRPKQVASAPRSTLKSEELQQSGKIATSATTSRPRSGFAVGPPSHQQKRTLSTKDCEQGPDPTANLEKLGTFTSQQMRTDQSHHQAQPSVEYEDDSDPPTPSSAEEGPERLASQAPGPSPMARVGGALSAFLKRLSCTLESDEDDSSSETDEVSSHKRISLTKPQEKEPENSMSSSEPVMSSSDLIELSHCLSPEQRMEFVAKVDDAARDMRKAMHPVSEDFTEEKIEIEEIPEVVSNKNAEDGVSPSIPGEGNHAQHVLKACGSGSNEVTTCNESNSPRSSVNIESDYAVNGEQDLSLLDDPRPSEDFHSSAEEIFPPSDSEEGEELEEPYSFGPRDTNQADHRSESEGDEIDYGDEDDEGSMESRDREVAAVVVDGDLDQVFHFPVRDAKSSRMDEKKPQEPVMEKPEELEDPASAEKARDRSLSIQALPDTKGTEHGESEAQTLGSESRNMSDDSTTGCDSMSTKMQKSVVSPIAAESCVSTVVDEVTEEAASAGGVKSVEDDISKNGQDSVPNGTSELQEKQTQVAALRKELSRLKKDDLKARLVQRELDEGGLKKDLVERLALHIMEGTSPAGTQPSQKKSSAPLRQRNEEKTTSGTKTCGSRGSHVTPRMLRVRRKLAGADLTESEAPPMPSRSARKTRLQAASRQDVEKASATRAPESVETPGSEAESEAGLDLSMYRQRTVKELRQFLTDRGLDVQQRMRKEELIQHLVTLSIGSDGQNRAIITEIDDSKSTDRQTQKPGEPEEPLSTGMHKAHHRMTVSQLRTVLKERDQCQEGTKKVLLERLSLRPERRTRSKKAADATSCAACQAGKICQAEGKR